MFFKGERRKRLTMCRQMLNLFPSFNRNVATFKKLIFLKILLIFFINFCFCDVFAPVCVTAVHLPKTGVEAERKEAYVQF